MEVTAKRQAERAEAFVAPTEIAEPTVEEKLKKKRKNRDDTVEGDKSEKKKKKRKAKEVEEDASS